MAKKSHCLCNCALAWLVFSASAPVVTAAPSTEGAKATVASSPSFSQRISLDLKGVDILDVLKLFSQKSGMNFVAGRNVAGRITIFVKDVDVWDAFDLIISANDLAYEKRDKIVTVMMARDYELLYGQKFQERKENIVQRLRFAKVAQVATVLNQIKSSVGRVVADEATNTLIVNDIPNQLEQMRGLLKQLDRPIESQVFKLNYTDAEKLKEKIQELLSPVGTFTFDARSNTVVISDLPESLTKARQVIGAFDVPDGQVLIEAKITKVTLNDGTDFGINWKKVLAGVDMEAAANYDQVTGNVLTGATGTTLRLLTSKADSQVILEALKEVAKTETIASPRIMAVSNQEAKILVGKKEAFITVTSTVPSTGSTVNTSQVQFVDVGTKLFVTPNVKHDGHIQMKIRPEVSSAPAGDVVTTAEGNRIPIVTTTEAETNVLVKSGSTIIIGGLIDSSNSKSDKALPWIGQIPILGLPFHSTSTQKDKTELVVFLTPQIIMPDGSAYKPATEEDAAAQAQAVLPAVVLQDPLPPVYRQGVRHKLQAHLMSQFHAASLPKGSVVVSFILSHDGQLVGEPAVTSPQGETFVAAAKEAIEKAQPFAPFPEGASDSEVRFRLAVDYVP